MSTQTPRVIAFDDIREGDRIEVAWSVGDLEKAYRGVVDYTSANGTWCTESGFPIATPAPDEVITLLHRPTATEPKGLGAVVRARVPASGGRLWTFVQIPVEWGNPPWQGPDMTRYRWSDFDPDSIEVLSEGIEVDQ